MDGERIMEEYNCDLHIHGRYSVASSKNISFSSLSYSSKKKGLHCLATGDILQKDWLKEAENLLEQRSGTLIHKEIFYILQTEIECSESIHHVVFLPDFSSVYELRKQLNPFTKNIDAPLSGRIHVSLSPEELVEKVISVNGLIGPAHAFTPFKSIFRWGKNNKLEDCYGQNSKHIKFLELGLSADTSMAQQLNSISNIEFLSNSDAHSDSLLSIGREFNRVLCEPPNFEEIEQSISRKNGRKIMLNAGLDPRMGKYYSIFCNKCRRRIKFKLKTSKFENKTQDYDFDDQFLIFYFTTEAELLAKKQNILTGKVMCPQCLTEHQKKLKSKNKNATGVFDSSDNSAIISNYEYKFDKILPSLLIRPGVSQRIEELLKLDENKKPQSRPPYKHILPLLAIISFVNGSKNPNSKSNLAIYEKLLAKFRNEINILLDIPIDDKKIEEGELKKIFEVIEAMRKNELNYEAGGGGTFGTLIGLLNLE